MFCLFSSSWAVSSLLCGRAGFNFMSWLRVFACGFLVLSFCGNLAGAFGHGRPGGVNIFSGFSHNRSVWVKKGTGPRARVFANGFGVEMGHRRGNKKTFSNFVPGNAIK